LILKFSTVKMLQFLTGHWFSVESFLNQPKLKLIQSVRTSASSVVSSLSQVSFYSRKNS